MFRFSPPRGRARRFALLAAVVTAALFLLPSVAGAAGEIEVPDAVTGRDALQITVSALDAPVVVEIRDAAGAVSSWTFAAGMDTLILDLSSPTAGTAPVNGEAAVSVGTEATGPLLSQLVTIDRAAATPVLSAVVRGSRVGLFWDAVDGPGVVTYRLERTDAEGAWATIAQTAQPGHTDRDLAPGRYRYRLSALVDGADRTPNVSGLTAAQVRIAAPGPTPEMTPSEPTEEPDPVDSEAPDDDAGSNVDRDDKDDRDTPRHSREVSVTGSVRGPVNPAGSGRGGNEIPRPRAALTRGTAFAPAVTDGMPPTQTLPVPVATPEIAPAGATPLITEAPVPTFDYFPVTVPPAGALVVEAGTNLDAVSREVVNLLAGSVFLALAASTFSRRRRSPRT